MQHIAQKDWTDETQQVAREIQRKAAMIGIPCQEDDIHVFNDGSTTYILGNPCIHTWEVLDDNGNPTGEIKKKYNIHAELPPSTLPSFDNGKMIVRVPRVVILIPSLCFRLRDGKIINAELHSDQVCRGLQSQLASETKRSWRMVADRTFRTLGMRG